MKNLAISIFVLILTNAAPAFAQKNSIDIGRINITGSGLSLVGTVTTTTTDKDDNKQLYYAGWGLIIVGLLIDAGDLSAQAPVVYSSTEVLRAMKTDCRVTQLSPELSTGEPIASTAESIDYLNGNVQGLCELLGKVIEKSNELPQGTSFSKDLALEVSGQKDLSAKDLNAIRNMFALNGII